MKYLPLQPNQYAGIDPVGALDPGGDTIVVLQDWEGAGGLGHSAVLIGGDDVGWRLFSKNGGASGVFGSSENPDDGVDIRTLEEFKTRANKDESLGRFDNGFLIHSNKEEDQRAKNAASNVVNSYYWLIGASYIDVVSDALDAAGKKWGLVGWAVPNSRVKVIIEENNAKDADDRVISETKLDKKREEGNR